MTSTTYRLPAEWARQSAVLIAWPHIHSDWQDRLDQIEPVYLALAAAISERERLFIVCWDDPHRADVTDQLRRAGCDLTAIHCFCAPTNDTWTRDTGPITVTDHDNKRRLLDFRFNGWGNKYPHQHDNALNRHLHTQGAFGDLPCETVHLVLEGGSIDVDGAGTLLTTTRCLLSPKRNPQYCQATLENRLRTLLGIERFLWLDAGYLAGDDTDSHVDMLARFCSTDTIAYTACNDPNDEHYAELRHMAERLRAFRRSNGRPYHCVPLPWPHAKFDDDGIRLPASYANFLILNDAVLVPTYNDPADTQALERIGTCFPHREIIGIPSLPLIEQRGGLHCATMQIPE